MPEEKKADLFSNQDAPWEKAIVRILLWVMYFGMGVLIILMLMTVVHATGRYGFDSPIEGLVELSCFMLVIIIFSTGAYTEVERAHIVIGTIVDRFSERTQAIIDSISYILALGLTLVAFWYTVEQGIFYLEENYVSVILNISHCPFVFFVALGWIMLAAAILLRLLRILPRTVKRSSQ